MEGQMRQGYRVWVVWWVEEDVLGKELRVVGV